MNNKIELSKDQCKALKQINHEKITFLTGGAGCGKTTTIAHYVKRCITDGQEVLVTASTRAATKVLTKDLSKYMNIKDLPLKPTTLYAALGIKPTMDIVTEKGEKVTIFDLPKEIDSNPDMILIIDEVSMLPKSLVELIVKSKFKKIILIGDECQIPPVKAKPYNFSKKLPTVELNVVHRTGNDTRLANYYSECRTQVKAGKKLTRYTNPTKVFTDDQSMVDYCKAYDGSFMILTYTNKRANKLARLLGYGELLEGEYTRLMSSVTLNPKNKKTGKDFRINNKDVVFIEKIFSSQYDMYIDSNNRNYQYWIPKDSTEYPDHSDDYVQYVRAVTDTGVTVYLALLFGVTKTEHDEAIAAKPNKLARDIFKQMIKNGIASNMSQLKNKLVKRQDKLLAEVRRKEGKKSISFYSINKWNPQHKLFTMETLYIMREHFPKLWDAEISELFKVAESENYIFRAMIPARSINVSTVHSAQGMSLDMVVVDWDATSKSPALQYTALSRARKDLCLLE